MSISTSIIDAWKSDLNNSRFGTALPRGYIYASQRRTCIRAMALDMSHPEDRNDFNEDALERMQRGKEREEAILARLMRIGKLSTPRFEVIGGQQVVEYRDNHERIIIRGKLDCLIKVEGEPNPYPAEVKSGQSVQNVTCLADLDNSTWTKHHLDQLLLYLLTSSNQKGLFIIDRPGIPTIIDVDLYDHLERAEGFLKDAEAAIDSLDLGILPEAIQDQSECKRCDHFGKTCAPDFSYGEGVKIITDEELISTAEIIVNNQDAAKAYEHAKDRLKEVLRGCPLAILGNVQVTGKASASTTYDIPKEIKEQYKKVNPEGKFSLTFSKIN